MPALKTREQWLASLAQRSASLIARSIADGGDEEPTLRLACGFPPATGRKQVLADILPPTASEDFTAEIFVSPEVDNPLEVARLVLPLLVVAHSGDYKRGARYREACARLGLTDGETPSWLTDRLNALGSYPHAQVTVPERAKQSTRLIKVVCMHDHDPYIARVSRKTLDTFKAPICPACLNAGSTRSMEVHA